MTRQVMQAFGVPRGPISTAAIRHRCAGAYQGREYWIEPDASAASYFWAAAAITGGRVTVTRIGPAGAAGRRGVLRLPGADGMPVTRIRQITVAGRPLARNRCRHERHQRHRPDAGRRRAVRPGPTTITGVAHIRHKETDRIGDLARELRKLGAQVEELPDGLRIKPGPLRGARIATYQDHRMAMSLALVGLQVEGVSIEDPQCTEKTYPDFFADLESLRRPGRLAPERVRARALHVQGSAQRGRLRDASYDSSS